MPHNLASFSTALGDAIAHPQTGASSLPRSSVTEMLTTLDYTAVRTVADLAFALYQQLRYEIFQRVYLKLFEIMGEMHGRKARKEYLYEEPYAKAAGGGQPLTELADQINVLKKIVGEHKRPSKNDIGRLERLVSKSDGLIAYDAMLTRLVRLSGSQLSAVDWATRQEGGTEAAASVGHAGISARTAGRYGVDHAGFQRQWEK